ncbi:MAG TPA: ImmA/IrrE family metallo-endopeptidase [Flexivirga sp.]|nr:ImmA/IrrE family metallo-endopeptidase [Flexivirga sp.]
MGLEQNATIDTAGVVQIANDLDYAERRCALMHELVHDERGVPHKHDPAEELAVEREAARRLISVDDLIDVARWALSTEEAAYELGVTEDMLLCRLSSMTHPVERAKWRAFVEEMATDR